MNNKAARWLEWDSNLQQHLTQDIEFTTEPPRFMCKRLRKVGDCCSKIWIYRVNTNYKWLGTLLHWELKMNTMPPRRNITWDADLNDLTQ